MSTWTPRPHLPRGTPFPPAPSALPRRARRPPRQPGRSEAAGVVSPAPPPPRAPLNLIWALALDGRSVWGPTPGQAFGAGVGVDVGGRHWFASLRAGGVPRAEESVATNVNVRFAGLDAALSLCRRGEPARALTVAGCLGFQASALRSQAVGSSDDTPVTAPGYAVLPALRVGVPLFSVVSVEAGFGLAAAIKRPAFAITGLGDVYRVPLLSPTVSVGVSVKL